MATGLGSDVAVVALDPGRVARGVAMAVVCRSAAALGRTWPRKGGARRRVHRRVAYVTGDYWIWSPRTGSHRKGVGGEKWRKANSGGVGSSPGSASSSGSSSGSFTGTSGRLSDAPFVERMDGGGCRRWSSGGAGQRPGKNGRLASPRWKSDG